MRRIYLVNSTAFHLNAARRHIRLARKQKKAEKFADDMLSKQQKLIEKKQMVTQAEEKREDAYDDIQFADIALDDTIRSVFEACKQYERKNPGEQVLIKLFPNGTFSDIVNMPYAKEPLEAERIAATIDTLGSTHALYPLSAQLRTDIASVNAAIEAYKKAVSELTVAQVAEETAKAELRQQYEFNYLDARKELGLTLAERIFPVLTTRSKENGDETTDSNSSAA